MNRFFKSLIKINNIIGFLRYDLKLIISAVTLELSSLFVPYKVKFNLIVEEDEKVEIQDLVSNGIVSLVSDKTKCKAIAQGFPVIIEDTTLESGCSTCMEEKGAGFICIPIIAGKEQLGSLSMSTPIYRPLSRDELEILVSVVNQVAVAIQRGKLLNKLQQEKATLADANREISALNAELAELVRNLQLAQDQLIHSEKLAATGRLAANVAHEINNPVGIILSRLECMLWESEFTPEVVGDLEVIKRQAQRIAEITKGLLSLSRKPSSDDQAINLFELITEAVSWLDHQLKKQEINLVLQLTKGLYTVGSREQLQQVIVNLLTNAKDAMPEGGNILIKLKEDKDPQSIKLEISDTGYGISHEELDKIFEPFYTSKKPGKGTGLGLFVSYNIIKRHRGEIKVESKLGKGTKFIIYLPNLALNKNEETPKC